jgi:hypothetical protein
MSPGELFLRIKGFYDNEEKKWHQLRVWAALYLNSIKSKKGKTIKPHDIIRLQMDKGMKSEVKKNISAEEYLKIVKLWQSEQ